MRQLFYFLGLFLLSQQTSFAQDHQEIDSAEDEKRTKEAVLAWADSIFYDHKEWKFDHFKAFYTDDYFIATMRAEAYKGRVEDLEKEKAAGRYKKSDDEYQKEHQELEDAYQKVKKDLDNFRERVTHFQIHFWSNIQTTDGITVYYEHIVKLDNDFDVTEATINSAIGKKNDQTAILYKADVKDKKKVDKVEKVDTQRANPNTESSKGGSVTIITPESDTPDDKTNDADSKKKKDKKKKK